MAEIVGIHAASHTPVMLNFPHLITADDLAGVKQAFTELGRRIMASGAQCVVMVSDDHLHNFFLDNLPAFAIGAAASYETPIESWLNAEPRLLTGDPALGAHLLGEAMEADFEPALSMHLKLDHGTLTPLELAGIPPALPIVPVLVNCTQPPLPTLRRCLQFGRVIGKALRGYGGLERVAVLATGGLSHDVGTPRMGMVNEEFDRAFLRHLSLPDDESLLRFTAQNLESAGNGAEEVRMWLIARGVAGATSSLDLMYYKALPDWYAGIGVAEWNVTT